MTIIHEGTDHEQHVFLVVVRPDGTHDEVQLEDEPLDN